MPPYTKKKLLKGGESETEERTEQQPEVGRTGGEEDEVDGGVDPSGGDDVGLRRGERVADPPDGAAGSAAADLPRVEPAQQEARVVHRRVPRAARQEGEHQHQHHEDDERREHRREERREVHLAAACCCCCFRCFLKRPAAGSPGFKPRRLWLAAGSGRGLVAAGVVIAAH